MMIAMRWRVSRCWAAILVLLACSVPAYAQTGSRAGETRDFGGITFVWCPPGTATLGTSVPAAEIARQVGGLEEWYGDEGPTREVSFDQGFWISKTPVTVEQWVRIGRAADLRTPTAAAGSDRPVTGVGISDIRAFIEAVGNASRGTFRLPTEAEWEYACRAGSGTLYPFGDDPDELDEHAWYRGNSPESIVQPVEQKQPNAWGLHDMLGNAWEVCSTPYSVPGTHGQTPSSANLVIRGGSVTSPAGFARSAYRAGRNLENGHPLVGFRIVREAGR